MLLITFVLRLRLRFGIYSVWIVFCIGVVAVSKIIAAGVFYIAWLGVALKSYGFAWERGFFVYDLYCRSLFIPGIEIPILHQKPDKDLFLY